MGGSRQSDGDLVEASRGGQVQAFRLLVERYQSLVCAVSYSATGDRTLSEDVAQETFVAAWKGLADLRDTSKLRSWLCGIARNLSSKALRRVGREIPSDALVEEAVEQIESGPSALDMTLSRETEQLVWAALQAVPETYREPLVMFYQQEQSTKRVAQALGVSENVVQQRLSRGRKHLRERVERLVERTLEGTVPAKGFSVAVVASISAGAVGAADAAHHAAAAASSGSTSILGGLLTMKALIISGVVVLAVLLTLGGSAVLGSRSQQTTESDRTPGLSGAGSGASSATKNGALSIGVNNADSEPVLSRPMRLGASSRDGTGIQMPPAQAWSSGTFRVELSEQMIASETLWQACLEGTSLQRRSATGIATLRFILAQNAEHPGMHAPHVELAEIDYDNTTLDDSTFLECVRSTPDSMSFGAPPEDIDAISIGFEVRVENGVYSGAGGREFAILRDSDLSGFADDN